MQEWLWWAHTVLAASLFDECQSLLQAMVCVGREMPTAAGGQRGEDAQASSTQTLDLLPLPDHECHKRRLQQRHPGTEVRGTRIPLLRQLPDLNPVLLWEARSQAAATLPLKSRKNRIFAGKGNPSWSGSPMLTQGQTEWNGYHPDKTCPY